MADVNNKLEVTEQQLKKIAQQAENIIRLEKEVESLEKELGTRGFGTRITDKVLGEDVDSIKEEDRSIYRLKTHVEELRNEFNGLKGVNINTDNIDLVTQKVGKLSESIIKAHGEFEDIYRLAAERVVGEFDTSNGFGMKADLNAYKKEMSGYADFTNKHRVDIDKIRESIEEQYDELISKEKEKYTELIKQAKTDEDKEKLSGQRSSKIEELKDLKAKLFEQEVDKILGETKSLYTYLYDNITGRFTGVNLQTVGGAINEVFSDAGKRILGIIKTNDQLENFMRAYTITGAREYMLENNPVGLLFGENIETPRIKELNEEIEIQRQNLHNWFPDGPNTIAGNGNIYASQEEVQQAYKELENIITQMEAEVKQYVTTLQKSGGYLTMYEQLNGAVARMALPHEAYNNISNAQINGQSIEDAIRTAYNPKLDEVGVEKLGQKLGEDIVNGLKESVNTLSNNEHIKDLNITKNITGNEHINQLRSQIEAINNSYTELTNKIKNTPIDIKSTGASFSDVQIKSYQDSLDRLILDGNSLRESMVRNFNDINSQEIKLTSDLSERWRSFIELAKSEIRLHITDDTSQEKLRTIDAIVNDIISKAGSLEVFDNTDAKVYDSIKKSLQEIIRQKKDFGNSDTKFVENEIQIQKYAKSIELLKQYRNLTSDIRNENFSSDRTESLNKIISDLQSRINKLKELNEKIQEKANALGIQIQDVPQMQFSKSSALNGAFDIIEKDYKKSLEHRRQLYEETQRKLEAQRRTAEKSIDKETNLRNIEAAARQEEQINRAAINQIKNKAEADKQAVKAAVNYFIEQQREQERSIQQHKREEEELKKLSTKVDEYSDKLKNLDTKGLDDVIEKINQAKEGFERAKEEANFENAKTSFNEFEEAYKEVVAHNEEIKEQEKAYEQLKNKVAETFNSIKKAISNVIGVIRTMNTILNKAINAIVDGFKVVISTIQRVIQLFGNLGNRIGLTGKNTNILKGSFTELKSAIDLVVGAFNKLFNNQFIQQGKKLLSSVQTLNMLMGTQLTQSTIEWAEKMENAFGLSAGDLIANLREVTAVMYGLGMTAQDVQVGARNLESVGMVLSSISGLSFETTMSKIQSGMKGMTQAIDDLGLSVRESQMDAYLKKLKAMGGEYANIGTSFSSLTEQQRVYVRYAAIMDQFMTKEAYSVERYAESLRTTTGSLSVLTSQLAGLKSAIGTLGLGLFSKILMPLIYVVHYITQLIIQLGELLGINMKLSSEMNGGTPIDTTPIEDKTKKLDEMADAASKAKGQLDELDHVTSMSSSSGSGKGGAGSDFDYSTLVGGFNFADALADVNENFLEECRQRLLGMLEQMKKDISDFVKDVTGRVIDWDILEERFDKIKQNIKAIFAGIGAVAENIFRTTAGLLYSIFDDMEFSKLFEKFTKNIADSLSVFNLILEKIAPYVQEFYNKYLSPYVIKFGEWLDSKLDDWGKKLHEITEYWIKLTPEQMEEGVDELGEKFNNLLTTLKQISIIIKTLFGKDTEKDNKFFNKTASDNMKKLKENVETLNGVFTALWDILKGILQDFGILDEKGNFSTEWIGPTLDKINEKLGLVKDWLSENKETIIELGEKIIETIAKLAETKFDLLMDVLNWVTDHAELVNGMLGALQGILDFVDQHPMLSFGIAIGMQLAGKSLISGSGTLAGGAVSAILGVLSGSLKSLGKGMGRLILGGMSLATRIGSAIGGAWTTIAPKVGELATRIGTKISSGITTALNGIDWAALGTGAFGVGASAALLAGVKESFNTLDREIVGQDGNKWENIKDFETLDNQQLQKYANQYYKFLREKYGTEIPKMAIDWMVDSAKKQLEETGLYTAEQIERMGNIINEDIYNNINHPVANIAKTGDFDAIINKVTVTDEYIKELDTTFNTSMTNMSKSVMSLDDVIGDSTSSSVLDFDALKKAAEDAKNDMTVDLNNLDNVVRTSTSNISGNVVSLDDVINGTATSVNESINTIGGNLSDKTTEVDTNLTILQGAFKLLGTTVGDVATSISSSVGTITSKFTELFTNSHIDDLKDLNKDMDQLNQSVGFGIVNNTDTSVKKVRNFYGHANGGIPSTGSLFLANENGNAELVGNFGGYTGVANNDMIMKAMSSAVYDAVTAALKNNSTGGSTVIEVCKGGVFVGDDAAIRQLANKINNINLVSRNTIANTGFVMS